MKSALILVSIFVSISCGVPVTREGKCQFSNERSSMLGYVYTCKMEKVFLTNELESFKVTGNHQSKGRQDPGVKFLEISSSNLSHIPAEVFEKFPNIEYLNVNEIGLRRIDKIEAKHMRVLLANKNRITELKNEIFSDCANLITISLRENLISSIEPGTFKKLANLQELYISSNKLESLHIEVFAPLINLQILSVSGNKLTTIEMEHLQMNRQLRESLFYDNQIFAIHPQAFVNQQEMFNLELHGNKCIDGDFRAEENFEDLLKNSLQKCFNNYPIKD